MLLLLSCMSVGEGFSFRRRILVLLTPWNFVIEPDALQERVIAKYKMKSPTLSSPASSSLGAAAAAHRPHSAQHSGPPSRGPKTVDAVQDSGGAPTESGGVHAAKGQSTQAVRPAARSGSEDQGMPAPPVRETSPPARQKMINAMTASTAGAFCLERTCNFVCACARVRTFREMSTDGCALDGSQNSVHFWPKRATKEAETIVLALSWRKGFRLRMGCEAAVLAARFKRKCFNRRLERGARTVQRTVTIRYLLPALALFLRHYPVFPVHDRCRFFCTRISGWFYSLTSVCGGSLSPFLAFCQQVEALMKARVSRDRKISEIKSLLSNLKT